MGKMKPNVRDHNIAAVSEQLIVGGQQLPARIDDAIQTDEGASKLYEIARDVRDRADHAIRIIERIAGGQS